MRKLYIWGVVFFLATIMGFYSCGEKEKTPAEINVELQKLELEIYEKINKNQKDDALNLLKELIHPSDKEWKEKPKMSSWESFTSGGNKYYTYNEWWTERRNELRDLILDNKNSKTNNEVKKNQPSPTEQNSGIRDSETITKSIKIVDEKFLGTYSFRNNNGEIKFYKILNTSDRLSKVLYQDNTGGNVTIKSFLVESFDQNSKVLLVVNEKNTSEKARLRLDRSTSNRKTIVDQSGQVFVFE